MKNAYSIIIYEKDIDEEYHLVYIPDFDKTTQASTIVESIEMARDLIGLVGMDYLEDKKVLPLPFTSDKKYPFDDEMRIEFETLVDIDFTEYRKRLENKSVKKH